MFKEMIIIVICVFALFGLFVLVAGLISLIIYKNGTTNYCKNCKNELEEGYKYCPHCSERLDNEISVINDKKLYIGNVIADIRSYFRFKDVLIYFVDDDCHFKEHEFSIKDKEFKKLSKDKTFLAYEVINYTISRFRCGLFKSKVYINVTYSSKKGGINNEI